MTSTVRPLLALHNATVRRALFPPLLALILLLCLLIWLASLLVSAAQKVEHSDTVIAQAHETLTLMIDAETGQRGYLAGGNSVFLEPYTKSQKAFPVSLEKLKNLVADNKEQTDRVTAFEAAYTQWAENAREMMTLRQKDDPAWLTRFNRGRGKVFMDQVRQHVDDLIDNETALRQQREVGVHKATRNALLGGGVGALLLGGLLVGTTRRQMHLLSSQYEEVLEEEKAARDQALHERGRLLATLTSIGDGVLATDAQGRITLINPITERLTGWSQDEAFGKDSKEIFDIIHEETGAIVPCPVDEVIEKKQIVLLANHTSLRHRDGSLVVIEDSAAPVNNAEGELAGVVLVFRDVTERKDKEQKIQTATEALRASVLQQRRLVREMLSSVTDGRLRLVDTQEELPALFASVADSVELTSRSLRILRRQVQVIATSIGFSDERAQDLLTAVGEASMNAVRHAGGGIAHVYADAERGIIQVRIQDTGKGIREEDLHLATLEKGWSGAGSLGHGFFLILRSVDRTYLLTGPNGTTVILEQSRIAPQPDWLQSVGD